MRNATCQALVELSQSSPIVFLTGDLGFMALEPLRDAMGPRFINAGVSEQNMVSVAAGLAAGGQQAWAYSIAPFLYARPFEQVRNDVCLQDRDVKLVANGGGYGYGPMGSSHHAIEDYGALLALPKMRAYVPAFADDLKAVIPKMAADPHPAYLRLGKDEKPTGFELPSYAPWRKLLPGDQGVLVVVGPLVGTLIVELQRADASKRPELWALSELPIAELPQALMQSLARGGSLCVVEEHVAHGSAGAMLAHQLMLSGSVPKSFTHLCAQGYPSGLYGSQAYHRKESGLDPESVLKAVLR